MIQIFLGYDLRESVGYHTCVQSIIDTTKQHVSISPVTGDRRDGTNDFVYARFLIPYLCDYRGWALFADGSDMIFREDVAALWALRDNGYAAMVVKHVYETKHSKKYVGTKMESPNHSYPRKNWSSLVLWNCEHPSNRFLNPYYVGTKSGSELHRFAWLRDEEIGALPTKWNVLIGEDGETGPCAVAHFTLGIPAMPYYAKCRYAPEWFATYDRMRKAG